MIDIEKQLNLSQNPAGKVMTALLKLILHEEEINRFIQENRHLRGFAFLDRILDKFHFSYTLSPSDGLRRIPAEGPLIIVANHPIGSLDGLALLKMVRSVRADVRIVANELLSLIEPLGDLFIPIDNLRERNGGYKSQYKRMLAALKNGEALIIFPAGEVSRIRPNGVRDGKWKAGFVKLAQKSGAPVLPIYIDARNSALFYALSTLYKPLGTLMLVQEMFNKQSQTLHFHIGHPVPATAFPKEMRRKALAQRMRRHTYLLPRPKKLARKRLFPVQEAIAPPVARAAIRASLATAERVGTTQDGMHIYLHTWRDNDPLMQEIGRLRELSFRSVEEGTGRAVDLDEFDPHYHHLVLWDEQAEEVVGAYRIGLCRNILNTLGPRGLYTTTLFELRPAMRALLPQAIELGRSFVQPRYWGRRSLEYLWYGIGAFLRAHPDIRYLYGPVSLSSAYPDEARALIALFYQCQCPPEDDLARALRPFVIPEAVREKWAPLFSADYATAFRRLNEALRNLGVKVPTLYKQYAEIALPGGCQFIDFNIDPDFNNAVDALVLVDIQQLVPRKKARYMSSDWSVDTSSSAAASA